MGIDSNFPSRSYLKGGHVIAEWKRRRAPFSEH